MALMVGLVLTTGACGGTTKATVGVVSPPTTIPAGPVVGAPVAVGFISDIAFSDSRHGFGTYAVQPPHGNGNPAIGVAITADGGRTWVRVSQQSRFGHDQYLENIAFVSPTVGLILASSVEHGDPTPDDVFVTHDAGRTWNEVPALGGAVAIVPTLSSVWVLTAQQQRADQVLRLWTSNAQARSWTETRTTLNGASATLTRVNALTAFDVQAGNITETTDGGTTWRTVGSQPSSLCFNNNDVDEHLSAPSPTSVWVVCGGEGALGNEPKSVFRSADGGRSWANESVDYGYSTKPTTGDVPFAGDLGSGSVTAVSSTTAYMALGRLGLEETIDGGVTWTPAVPGTADTTTLDVVAPTTSIALLDGAIYATTDGTTWKVS